MDSAPSHVTECSQHRSFKIVGDNIDKNVKPRYLRSEGHQNRSLHYFHSYAVRERIDFSHLPDILPPSCMNSPQRVALSLLPSKEDDQVLRQMFVTHVSRVLCKYMSFFKFSFEDVIQHHIRHPFYDEMSAKSEVVSCKHENIFF